MKKIGSEETQKILEKVIELKNKTKLTLKSNDNEKRALLKKISKTIEKVIVYLEKN